MQSPEDKDLEAAMLLVYTEKRPKTGYLCLGNDALPLEARIYSFNKAGDLTKHFKRKHLFNIKEKEQIKCEIRKMILDHKMHLQRHAFDIHSTVS
jgi:uncharacterized protein Smg (DUF494 family)